MDTLGATVHSGGAIENAGTVNGGPSLSLCWPRGSPAAARSRRRVAHQHLRQRQQSREWIALPRQRTQPHPRATAAERGSHAQRLRREPRSSSTWKVNSERVYRHAVRMAVAEVSCRRTMRRSCSAAPVLPAWVNLLSVAARHDHPGRRPCDGAGGTVRRLPCTPGAIALIATGTLNLNGTLINQDGRRQARHSSGAFFESPEHREPGGQYPRSGEQPQLDQLQYLAARGGQDVGPCTAAKRGRGLRGSGFRHLAASEYHTPLAFQKRPPTANAGSASINTPKVNMYGP